MEHSFDTDLAADIGIEEAIIFKNISYWVAKNKANETNYFDGDYWTFNSTNAFRELFYYMSPNKVRTALEKLEREGYVKVGNYNKSAYDRTKWYALTDFGKSICGISQLHLRKSANGNEEIRTPIPYINTDRNSDEKQDLIVSNDTICRSADRHAEIEEIVRKWNETTFSHGIPSITRMKRNSNRYKWCNARIQEYGKDEVIRAIEMIPKCPFLIGKSDAKYNFNFTFDWFIRPNNFVKVLDGNYLEKGEKPQTQQSVTKEAETEEPVDLFSITDPEEYEKAVAEYVAKQQKLRREAGRYS